MDVTGDCRVDFADFAVFASQWLDESLPDPCGMEWVYIDDPGVDGHEGGFTGYMSKYETTNAQYCEYLNAALADGLITLHNNSVYAGTDTGHSEPYFNTYAGCPNNQITYNGGVFSVRSRDGYDMSNHPVVEVSWYGATAFCNYYGYRLPTEWEWQAVADYNGSFTYGCGTTINNGMANYYGSTHPYGTTVVGAFGAYGYGMCDMAGNVLEWTSSLWNPQSSSRVVRGGCWDGHGYHCAVSSQYSSFPFSSFYDLGFRVCR